MKNQNLAQLYNEAFSKNWDSPVFSDYDGATHTFKQVGTTIKSLHLFYQLAGLQPGDKIALLGRNSSNWGAVFLSALSSGLVIVPILPDFNENDTNHIINHSESKLVFSSRLQLDKIDLAYSAHLKGVVVLDDFSLHVGRDENLAYKLADGFQYYKENTVSKSSFHFSDWKGEDLCMISYTSGTSGFTKGVMIPARSLHSNLIYARENMPLQAGDRIVSFLPMAHVYGLLFEFLFPVTLGCHISFLSKMPTPAVITKAFGDVQPHLILSVPLIIEKIYKKKIQPALDKPAMKILLNIPGISALILKKIRKKMLETFGGRFFEIVIGGAPLNAEVEKFFKRIKFPFTVGYGMTECGPLISYAAWNKTKSGSAGALVDRMEVRIDSEDPYNVVGEIQVKGENVMLGYFKNEEETKASFTDDGWLRTGDLGIIDRNNFIFIRGRSKNMILGASGQNIYPEEIEAKLGNKTYVAECVVIERKGKLVALVYPDFETMQADQVNKEALPEIMEGNRKRTNAELPRYEQISAIELVNEEFEKTPKKNIKRYKYV
ncbi:long-chain fatty acid--CoA ligase [Maribellus luteus]|uniref:Long-chain fatty acid--CoA ligase n=1 Tax=Maribellus luteus TaxID=2305463 RepID=A0A399T3K2_9BACT|nr:AMP-binding protein [Maribellus luteus]RIJ49465.1 long-chain fatty acid--CoA ligase [Maribellus luteus]